MKRKAILAAVAATILWSGSYVLNKLAFQSGIGPLTLSGFRYLFASLFLLSLKPKSKQTGGVPLPLTLIVLLGVLGYAIAQGMQYVGQTYLTPTQSSLFLAVGNTTLIMVVDRVWLRENQTAGDLAKLLFLVGGIALYYYPWGGGGLSFIGMSFIVFSSVGYALNVTLTRRILIQKKIDTRTLVARPMLAGALVLVVVGLLIEGLPAVTPRLLLILAYLSLISGALGFYLWTWSQKELTAFESSSINNLMLIEIALMDFLIFNRSFSAIQIIAILVVFGSVLAIQRKKPPRISSKAAG